MRRINFTEIFWDILDFLRVSKILILMEKISKKKFGDIDLAFDFTSFFAWTFKNFRARHNAMQTNFVSRKLKKNSRTGPIF